MVEISNTKILYESVQIKSARFLTGDVEKKIGEKKNFSNEVMQQGNDEEFEHSKPVNAINNLLGNFEIELECIVEERDLESCDDTLKQLEQYPLEFEMIYVANSANSKEDQLLEKIELGPLNESGVFKFTMDDVKAPDYSKIPNDQLLGITFAILRCAYRGKVFTNIGFYVETSYDCEELNSNPPDTPKLKNLMRSVYFDSQINDFPFKWQANEEYYKQKPIEMPDGIFNFDAPGLFGNVEQLEGDGCEESSHDEVQTDEGDSEEKSVESQASNLEGEGSSKGDDEDEQEMEASEQNDENVDITKHRSGKEPESKMAKLEIEPTKSNDSNILGNGLNENHKSS